MVQLGLYDHSTSSWLQLTLIGKFLINERNVQILHVPTYKSNEQ